MQPTVFGGMGLDSLGFEHYLDAIVHLMAKDFIAILRVFQVHPMGNDKRGINIPLLNMFQQQRHVLGNVRLSHLKR